MKAPPGPLCVCEPARLKAGAERGVFLLSDLHLGAAACDQRLLEAELAAARKNKDRVCVNGDVFDLILTRDDKRYSPAALHPRLQGRDDLVNAAVDMAYDLLSPYADLLDMVGVGNHETAVEKRGNTDPVALLIRRLDEAPVARRAGHRVRHGGYAGFLRYRFEGGPRHEIFYWHGSGGGSFASGLSEFVKKGRPVEGADTVWFGHRHVRTVSQLERWVVGPRGVTHHPQWLIRTGAYLASHGVQTPEDALARGRRGNYAADALLAPTGRGGVRLVLGPDGSSRVEVRS